MQEPPLTTTEFAAMFTPARRSAGAIDVSRQAAHAWHTNGTFSATALKPSYSVSSNQTARTSPAPFATSH